MSTQSANRDPLTGVWNRKYVSGLAEGILGHNGQIALILIDVDQMKHYLDNFGLQEGDHRLKEIAREIEASSGNSLVFRTGGDEFGVVLYESSLDTAREVAETIRAKRQPTQLVTWNKVEVTALTLSLGVAHFPTQASNWENLLAAANSALLKAKNGGRLLDGTSYIGRNCVMAIGDFLDESPEPSA